MASATEDPILIPSDDEGSDADDVVLVKEEIEVDTDDVIFLSETKPAPGPNAAASNTENTASESSDKQAGGTLDSKVLNLSSKSSPASQSSNGNGPNTDIYNMDISSMCNYYLGPLDLSSKSDSQSQCDTTGRSGSDDIQDLFKSLLFDTDVYNNSHLDASSCTSTTGDTTTKDIKLQGPQVSSNTPCDKMSGLDCDNKNDTKNNSDQSSAQGSDSSKCVSLPDLSSKTFNIDSLLGVSTNSAATPLHSTSTVTTTNQTNMQSVINPLDPQILASNATTVNNSDQVVSSSTNIDSSQIFLKSTDPMWSSKDSSVKMVKNSRQCYQMDAASQIMPYSQPASSAFTDCFSMGLSLGTKFAQSSSLSHTLNQPIQQTGFQPVVQISQSSQSGNLASSQIGPQINTQMQISSGTLSSNLTGPSLSQGLPGGSQSFTSQSSVSNQSAFKCLDSTLDNQSVGNPPLKRSVSLADQTYMYNPLTLPKSEKESYLRSFSTSSLNSWSSDSYKRKIDSAQSMGSLIVQNAADGNGPYQLPPKKQKRCFSDCISCKINLSGETCCRCPNGHSTCAKCLEERVKKVLTGKAKESIRCLNVSCDSFYPISELKKCLPSMVVEILEDKLDQDYVDYFSTMMLKSAFEGTSSDASTDIDMDEEEGLGASSMVTIPKKPAETDPELPGHWEPMNEKSAYQMFTLDVESDEYNQVLPLFFSSMVNHKVEVVNIKRIQNPILWKFYTVKRKEMLLDNEGFGTVNEQQLYHGTDASVVDAICKKGFDWRVCGKNGTMYGQGTYFAVNASYSHQYTDIKAGRHSRHATLILQSHVNFPMSSGFGPGIPSQGQPVIYNKHAFPPNVGLTAINLSSSSNQMTNLSRPNMYLPVQTPMVPPKHKVQPKPVSIRTMSGMATWPLEELLEEKKHTTQMFVARVLVGKYSGGSSKLRKPPPLDPKSDPFGKCYDSCVDNIHMPKIFVIFDSAQAYPEYLIEYTYD